MLYKKNNYRYSLASNKVSKLDCPNCGAKKHWQRYIDVETGHVLPEKYGRCDNEQKCGYGLNPYEDGYSAERLNGSRRPEGSQMARTNTGDLQIREPVYIPESIFNETLIGYERNGFISYLIKHAPYPFDKTDVEKVIGLYYLGTKTEGDMRGALCIPYIDYQGNIRAIQTMRFDKNNHKCGISFLHSLIKEENGKKGMPSPDWLQGYMQNSKKVDCLFGEHLLSKHPLNPIALVEAPKTAIYGTLYFGFPTNPGKFIWLASYNRSSLTYDKCKILKNRKVVLFPDLSSDGSTFKQWAKKAEEFNRSIPGASFTVSDLIEKYADSKDKEKGLDLADFLVKLDWRRFRDYCSHTD